MDKRLLAACAAAPMAVAPALAAEPERPNILLFMVDDMGWQDTSVPFGPQRTAYNDTFETPGMERLARTGTLFTQAYASSISSPSRCSLLTGANAARHRVTNWTFRRDTTTDAQSATLTLPEWNCNGIRQGEGTPRTFAATSFVELLRRAGYRTIHCGKAHFGALGTPGEDPHHFGFEVNIAGHAAGGLASYLGERNYGNGTDGGKPAPFAVPGLEKYWGSTTFVTEALTREAIAALDEARSYGQPWFLYMAHYAVHIPIDRDARFFDKYKRRGLSDREAAYAALIEGMDKSLCDLLDWLDRTGEADRTIVIFMSDNGGLAAAPAWRDGAPHTQNAPLRSGKGSAYEGGIREPMIVRWPGVTPGGGRCDSYLLIEDFYPTILEMAGIGRYRTAAPVDGVSFVPLLRGTGDPSRGRALCWNCPNLWDASGPGIGATCTIRDGRWKLIHWYETSRQELYDIDADLGEEHDLAADEPQRVRRLARKLGRYLRRVGAQRPSFRATGQPCPWPDEAPLATAANRNQL